jgi:hypothetical protein
MCLVTSPNAQTVPEDKCDSPFRVYFGNGIANDAVDADKSLVVLQTEIGPKFGNMPVSYGNAFTPTGGFVHDLYVVFKQKLVENPSLTWDIFARVFLGLNNGIAEQTVKIVQSIIAEVESKKSEELKAKFISDAPYYDQIGASHVSQVLADILRHGRRVLLVAHSQGTLYANSTYKHVYENPTIKPGNFGIVGVASAANYMAGGGLYTTSDSDVVINALRSIITSSTLPANTKIPFNQNDFSGHQFVETYMNSAFPAKNAIVSNIKYSLAKLVEPATNFDYTITYEMYRGETDHADPFFDYSIYLSGSYECYYRNCLHDTFIMDSNGTRYPIDDPALPAISQQVIRRLSPFAPEVADRNSALGRFVTLRWPGLFLTGYHPQHPDPHFPPWYMSFDYDVSGELNPEPNVPPDGALPKHPQSMDYPKPDEVFISKLLNPFIASINQIKGTKQKISFEYSEADSIWVIDGVGHPIPREKLKKYKLKICKPSEEI